MATTEGVVRVPSWFGITTGSPPCITATTELVVPRSIPIILLIASFSFQRLPETLVPALPRGLPGPPYRSPSRLLSSAYHTSPLSPPHPPADPSPPRAS